MPERVEMKVIAHIRTEFPTKFGIPRQSGLVSGLRGAVVFEPEYRRPEAFRGLEGFTHIWLIWQFSKAVRETWSPTVRPPRLGGNTRLGVFGTRSPFRPNAIGLSCVELLGIDLDTREGPVIWVAGADLMDKTPIFDLKPYLPYADCRPEAKGGFASEAPEGRLQVDFPLGCLERVPAAHREALQEVLACDPRPSYQEEPGRIYGLSFGGIDVKFTVGEGRLRVLEVNPLSSLV